MRLEQFIEALNDEKCLSYEGSLDDGTTLSFKKHNHNNHFSNYDKL